jgi:hypothetical protein
MRKIIVLFLIPIAVNFKSTAQKPVIPYYDAVYIRENCLKFLQDSVKFKNVVSLTKVLLNYYPNIVVDDSTIKAQLKTNPFLISFLPTGGFSQSLMSSTYKGYTASSIGGLNVTNFADGLAKFVVERVKQELSAAFFERFKKDLNSNEQLKIMFPASCDALNVIGDEIYNYSAYLDLLRESFKKDMVLLLPHIRKLVDDKSMDSIFSQNPEIKLMLSHALYIENEFSEGKFPGEVFHGYVVNEATKDALDLEKVNKFIYPSLETLDLLSQSIRSQQDDQYWVDAESLKLLFDDVTFQIYLGLVYQQAVNKPIKFTDKIDLASKMHEYGQKITSLKEIFKPYLIGLVEKGSNIKYYYTAIKESQKTGKDKPTYQDYYSLYDATVNFLEYSSQSPFLENLLKQDNMPNLMNYFSSVRSMGNIYIDLYEKQYSSAIVEFTGIVQTVLSSKIKANNDLVVEDNSRKSTLENRNADLKKILNVNSLILKYGSLAASISKAENSEDVKNAVEAASLPVGSSRIKRETEFNVALNAYCGLFAGHEEEKFSLKNGETFNSFGVTAPIGLSVSWGHSLFPFTHGIKWGTSSTLFISLIDLGAVTAFRFINDTTKTLSKIELKDIISPGIFLSWGIPKSPISVNLGYQITPYLRDVNITDNSFKSSYSRFSASVCVDIPLLNFYTKPR